MCVSGGSMSFQITGSNGKYDGVIKDDSERYGRNVVSNHQVAIEKIISNYNSKPAPILDFSQTADAVEKNIDKLEEFIEDNDKYLSNLPPLEYEYRYLPNSVMNTRALLGTAYEEMGQVKQMSVKEFEQRYLMSNNLTAEPIDINKDGNIDVTEYASNIVAADVLSKGTTDPMKADGVINSKGINALLEYSKKSNAAEAAKLYSNIYKTYNLGNALSDTQGA